MKQKVIKRKIIIIALAFASLLFAVMGIMFAKPETAEAATTVYNYSKESDFVLGDLGTSFSATNINNSSAVVTKTYSISVSSRIVDEVDSKYNHLVIAYGRKDLMDNLYLLTTDTPERRAANVAADLDESWGTGYRFYYDCLLFRNGLYWADCRGRTSEPHIAFENLKPYDKTGTFNYVEITSKSELNCVGNYSGYTYYYSFNIDFAENNAYDVGVYYFYYYATIFNTDMRAMRYSTDSVRSDLDSRVKNASAYSYDVVGAYERALGIYRSGNTTVQYNYLKMQEGHFNKYENCTGSISVPSVYIPDSNYIKNLVLQSEYANGQGLVGYNAVYKSYAGYEMSNGVIGKKETFGSRIIRQATGTTYSYSSGQIPATVSVDINYADYRYSDFFIRIANSGNPNYDEIDNYIENDLNVDIYPTSVENKNGRYYLYFDYQTIFDLFRNTLHWEVLDEDFILTYNQSDVQSGVYVEEETLSGGNKRLAVSFQEGYESRLFGLEITGNVPITPPTEMNVTVEYSALNDDLTTVKKSFSAGLIYDNTFGEFKASLLNPDGPYSDVIYGELEAPALRGITFLKPVHVLEVTDYTAQTARFAVQYEYSTSVLVITNNLNEDKWVFNLSDSASEYTLKELGVDSFIPSGYRISSFTGNRIEILKENEDRFNELNTIFRRGDRDKSEPYIISLNLTDKWPIKINYLEQWKKSPFAVMKEFNGEIRVADYPDLLSLTGEDVSKILDKNIIVLQFLKVAIKIDKITTTYDAEKDAYVVDLAYSHLSILARDYSTTAEEIKVALTPFSMWCEFFGKDWSIMFFNNEEHRYFDYSNDVPKDKLYGFFSYVVFKDKVSDFSEWLHKKTSGGVSVLYNYSEVKGSDFYKFMRGSTGAFAAAGAAAGLLFGKSIKAAATGAVVGTLINHTINSIAEEINDDNGTYYTYFFFLDGTTDIPWVSDTGATSRDDDDSAIVNRGQEIISLLEDSDFIKILKIIGIVIGAVIVGGVLYKLVKKFFFEK